MCEKVQDNPMVDREQQVQRLYHLDIALSKAILQYTRCHLHAKM